MLRGMEILSVETAVLGALAIFGFVVVARLFRRGMGTYAQRQSSMRERIRKTSADIRENTQSMPVPEHMALMDAVLRELLFLAGNPEGCRVERRSREALCLHTPGGVWSVRFVLRVANLRSSRRTLHGGGQWEVIPEDGADIHAFRDLAQLMRYLDTLVRPDVAHVEGVEAEPPEFRRRFSR